MTRYFDRDALGELHVAKPGELPCLCRNPFSGHACQAPKGHAPPCRYYSELRREEWWPQPGASLLAEPAPVD